MTYESLIKKLVNSRQSRRQRLAQLQKEPSWKHDPLEIRRVEGQIEGLTKAISIVIVEQEKDQAELFNVK